MDNSPAANHDHTSVALTPQPDGPFVRSNTFVACNNHAAPSCSSSQQNNPLLAQHVGSSSVDDILSTPGHGCSTSCHLSPSDNDQLASSADKVCAPDCNGSASCSNSSLSGPPVSSSPCRSGSPTGYDDKSTTSHDHNSPLADYAHPCSSSSAGSTDGNHS